MSTTPPPQRELVVEYTLICTWCGVRIEHRDSERVWVHSATDLCMCAGYRKIGTRATETWAEPTMWRAGEDGWGDG